MIIRPCRPPSRSPHRLARLYRPGPEIDTQAPCRRCQLSGQPCIFEKPEKKNGQLLSSASVECVHVTPLACLFFSHPFFTSHRRLSRLEGQYVVSPIILTAGRPLLRPPQGHAEPNDWPSNVPRPHSCCCHPTRRSRCYATWASHLPSDYPRRSRIRHKCVRNSHRS